MMQVNAERSFYDPFRLNTSLDQLITGRTGAAKVANSAALMATGDRAGAQDRVVQAREKLAELLRNGFAYLKALPALDVPAADVSDALESYGWERGLLGDLVSPLRLEALAGQAASATPELNPAVLSGGAADADRELAGHPAGEQVHRGRGDGVGCDRRQGCGAGGAGGRHRAGTLLYSSASDERDQTPELAKRELTIPDLPAHATSIKGWRQAAGGQPEVAGVSVGVTVSIGDFEPAGAGRGLSDLGDGPQFARRWPGGEQDHFYRLNL